MAQIQRKSQQHILSATGGVASIVSDMEIVLLIIPVNHILQNIDSTPSFFNIPLPLASDCIAMQQEVMSYRNVENVCS